MERERETWILREVQTPFYPNSYDCSPLLEVFFINDLSNNDGNAWSLLLGNSTELRHQSIACQILTAMFYTQLVAAKMKVCSDLGWYGSSISLVEYSPGHQAVLFFVYLVPEVIRFGHPQDIRWLILFFSLANKAYNLITLLSYQHFRIPWDHKNQMDFLQHSLSMFCTANICSYNRQHMDKICWWSPLILQIFYLRKIIFYLSQVLMTTKTVELLPWKLMIADRAEYYILTIIAF